MGTPQAAKACHSTETPDTTFSSIFDSSDSPLSSPSSSILGDLNDKDASEYEEEKPPRHPKPSNCTQAISLWDDLNNCGTASSQRERRAQKKAPVYSNFFSEVKKQSPDLPQVKVPLSPTAISDAAQPAATTREIREDEETSHQTTLKRKEQATASDSNDEPIQKKVKTASARRCARSKLDTEPAFAADILQPTGSSPANECAPSRQLRKRKLETTVTEVDQPPPSKKVKTAPAKAQPKPKGTSPRKPRRAAPPVPKKRKSTGQATVTTLQEKKGSVVVLKMSPHRLAGLGHNEEQRPATEPALQQSFTDAHETFPFEQTSFQSMRSDPDQCAQPVPAPIPASSQLTSFDGSQLTHSSFQAHKADTATPSLETVPEEAEASASQNLPTPPYLPAEDPEVPKTHPEPESQSQSSLPFVEHAVSGPENVCSMASTQPTLILKEPYSGCHLNILLFQG
jgi:hypothetical protein